MAQGDLEHPWNTRISASRAVKYMEWECCGIVEWECCGNAVGLGSTAGKEPWAGCEGSGSTDTKKGGTGRYKLCFSGGAVTTAAGQGQHSALQRHRSNRGQELQQGQQGALSGRNGFPAAQGTLHSISTSSTSKNSFAFGGILVVNGQGS